MYEIIVYADGMEVTRFTSNDLTDVVLQLDMFRVRDDGSFFMTFHLLVNRKEPTDAVWREYHDLLYKLMPVAKKMVKMETDF